MNKILFSAVTKKFVMALAGLFLLLFLPVHLGINLLLLKGDSGAVQQSCSIHGYLPACQSD